MPADGLGLSPHQIEDSWGQLLDYCPVTLIDQNKLYKGEVGLDTSVMYRGRLYKAGSPSARDALMKDPERYLLQTSLMARCVHGGVPVLTNLTQATVWMSASPNAFQHHS